MATTGRGSAEQFPEWTEPPAGGPIRQGDVISSVVDSAELWRQNLVVITADCDLAKAKHDGALTCVPILRLTDYLRIFRFEKLRDSLATRIAAKLLADVERANPEFAVPNISLPRLKQWVLEEDSDAILQAFGSVVIPAPVRDLMNVLKSLLAEQPEDLSSVIDLLAGARLAVGDFKELQKAHAATANDLASTLKSLPGDVLLLNEISAVDSEGYVVYLRRAFEIPDSSVVISYSRLPHDAHYARISRLRAPYVYALTQQFGAVFSAIGLPNSYEQARESIASRIKSGEY
ncbi:MAG: hypothetical protein OSB43_16600 [Nocardioides sp.]|uniref:hypothetical protein n=1 Tax=Nocardioides sp. TaxID=35761 RepID=UPI0023A70A72|nr:hypothetical protein [Nocardioides sp.]MDE0777897.1 hypothetical protein [Nocardioides sp.]